MAQDVGKSHGFGRVSPVTRPSPYSPVQFRGGRPASSEHSPAAPPRHRGLFRRAVAGVALAAVAAAGIAYFTLYRGPAQPPARTVVDAAMLAALVPVDPAAPER